MHDQNNAHGDKNHAKEDIAPNANILNGGHEIGSCNRDAKERHGKEYGGITYIFDRVCKNGWKGNVVPKDKKAKDRHDSTGAKDSF